MDSQEEEQAQAMIQQEDVMNSSNNNGDDNNIAVMGRKEKRKAMKKMKRKQLRKEIAIKDKQEEEARLNDPQEQIKMARLQQEEAERMEKERIEFEEREKQFLQALELKKLQEEEQLNQCKDSLNIMVNEDNAEEKNEDDGWEYVEEGRAEIIWKGNEIIVKKKKVKVPKRSLEIQKENKESERPISNPLAPQSEAYENHRNAQDILQSVAQQVPNFGTEQDKEHCPFHLKTGACRFGTRCSRVHFYPDKACTLLLKNMYHGPGLAWEQDEGLEYTDEEAEQSFEDFYEDVHTEFLKFGEIVNFKVCRNGSSHLRGNVYVHYKSLESAVFAYQSINGRYFAGKQLTCEFVNVTRWRVAICGEYMKSKLKTCSRGSACNFIHCFRNPCGDYEWADWDKPAPRCWLKSMAALFGYSGDRFTDGDSPGYHSRSSRFRALGSTHEDDGHRRRSLWRHKDDDRKANNCAEVIQGRNDMHQDHHFTKHRKTDDGDRSNGSTGGQRSFIGSKRSSKKRGREPDPIEQDSKCGEGDAISAKNDSVERGVSDRYLGHNSRSSNQQKRAAESAHEHCQKKDDTHAQENTCAEKHYNRFHKHKGKYFLQEREGLDSSNIEAHHDSLDSEEDEHYRHSRKNRRRMKNEADLSSTASDEDGLCRVKDRSQKTRRKSSKSKSKRSVTIRSDEDGLDCCEDRQHRFVEKNSRLKTNIKESFDGRDRLGRGEKRQRKVLSLKDQSVTDMESDRDEARRHRHRKKHSRQSKHDADSSESAFESDRSGRYERRPQKRSTSFKSCKESDVTDLASSREKGVGEERRRRHRSSAKHHMKVRGSSKIDSNADSRFKVRDTAEDKDEADGGNFDTYVRSRSSCADLDQNHPVQESIDYQGGILSRFSDTEKCNDSIDGVLVCRRDIKRCGKDHMLQSNKSDEGANVSTEAETCSVPTIHQDFDADTEAEHEKACRHAALKKLEEKKKNMDSQAVHGRESVESFRFCSHEHTVAMESGSSKLGTNVASIQRRRI